MQQHAKNTAKPKKEESNVYHMDNKREEPKATLSFAL